MKRKKAVLRKKRPNAASELGLTSVDNKLEALYNQRITTLLLCFPVA